MIFNVSIILSVVMCCECVNVYSSFWTPLFDPSVLGYRVDASFDPESGKLARGAYNTRHGYRGQNLIADLGNGKRPTGDSTDDKIHGAVKFYYTYPGANSNVY